MRYTAVKNNSKYKYTTSENRKQVLQNKLRKTNCFQFYSKSCNLHDKHSSV